MSKAKVTLTTQEILALHELMNQHAIATARDAAPESDGYTEAALAVRDFAGATAGTIADIGRGLFRAGKTLIKGKEASKPRLTAEQVALLKKAGLA